MGSPRNSFLVSAVALIVAAGCSSGAKGIKANGRLLLNEAPLKVSPDAGISIVFISIEDKGPVFKGIVNREDGTFYVPGKDGNGIPAGKYRIAISQKMLDPPEEVERLNSMFSGGETAIVRDVEDETPIILELSKPEG